MEEQIENNKKGETEQGNATTGEANAKSKKETSNVGQKLQAARQWMKENPKKAIGATLLAGAAMAVNIIRKR